MGSEQSRSAKNTSNDAEINRALQQQRMIFERQTQDMLQDVIQNLQIQPPAPASTPRLYPNLGVNENNNRQSPVAANSSDFVIVNNHRIAPHAPTAPPASPPQQRSSRPRSNDDVNCPTCHRGFSTKIFNCLSGHASCMDCRSRWQPCGVCGATITAMRNISMEEVVLQFKSPCYNADEGCCLSFKLADMENHLKECPFREIECLLQQCMWKGKLSQLATHFNNSHPSQKGEVDTEMFLQVNRMYENKRIQLIKIGNFNFVFNLKVCQATNSVYIAVQLIGTKHSAAKWSYELHIYDKSAPRRKYQYIDKCFSHSEPFDDLQKENKCAVISLQYAQTFINNGTIAYKFYIKKEGGRVEPRDVSSTRQNPNRRDVSCNRRGRGRGGGRKFNQPNNPVRS